MQKKEQRTIKPIFIASIVIYILLLFLWAMWQEKWNEVLELGLAGEQSGKLLIWGLIPVIIIRIAKPECMVPLKDLVRSKFPFLACVVICCICVAFLHTVRLANGLMNTHVFLDWRFVLISLVAGVAEEIGFRGCLYNVQAMQIGEKPAAILNGFLFCGFHYTEILFGRGFGQLFSLRTLLLFTMGIIFCWMLSKWKNISLNITVHTVWDIASYLFVLG